MMNSDNDKSSLEVEMTKPDQAFRPTFGKWILFLGGTLNFSLALSIPVSLSVMFLDWQESFQVSRAYTAAVHSTCVGILFGGGILAGYLMNRIGSRLTVLLGASLASLGLLVSCFATSIHFLIATTGVIAGFGFCLLQLPTVPCVTQPFTKYKSLVIAMCVFGAALLSLGLPSFYKMLVHEYSWRGAYFIITGLTLNTFVTSMTMTSYITSPKAKLTNIDKNDAGALEFDINFSESLEVDGVKEEKDKDRGKRGKNEQRDSFDEETQKVKETNESTLFLQDEHIQLETEIDESKNRNKSLIFTNFRASKWSFLADPLFHALLLMLMLNLGASFSFYILMMDFAKTSGFPSESTGVLFILITLSASLCGRIGVGLLNLLPRLHSFYLVSVCGLGSCLSMVVLAFVTDFIFIILLLALVGLGMGGIISIFPKCILDIHTVSTESFPLALGIASTAEGICDFVIPIVIGYMVDETGSYFLPLSTLGSVGILVALTLLLSFCYIKKSKD